MGKNFYNVVGIFIFFIFYFGGRKGCLSHTKMFAKWEGTVLEKEKKMGKQKENAKKRRPGVNCPGRAWQKIHFVLPYDCGKDWVAHTASYDGGKNWVAWVTWQPPGFLAVDSLIHRGTSTIIPTTRQMRWVIIPFDLGQRWDVVH